MGDALARFHDRVIATKLGWDIDPETGEHRGGVNSHPEQIRAATVGDAAGCPKRVGTSTVDQVTGRVPPAEYAERAL